jgi:hypothetical protein
VIRTETKHRFERGRLKLGRKIQVETKVLEHRISELEERSWGIDYFEGAASNSTWL